MKLWYVGVKVVAAAALVVLLGPLARAQNPGGEGTSLSPAAQAKMKAWRKFRDNHKQVVQVGQTVRALGEMDKDPKTKLTKDQAKKILAVMKAWRTKPVMTNDQALAVNKQLTDPLTLPQIKKMATLAQGGRRGGGGGMGRPGGGGGPGGADGGRGGFDPSRMPDPKEYNPLNPNSLPASPMSARAKQRMSELVARLEARAKA